MQATRSTRGSTSAGPILPAALNVLAITRRAWLGTHTSASFLLRAAPQSVGDAVTRHRLAAARLVARVYRSANQPLRADMLLCLLRPLGTLSLVGVASGAFANLLPRSGGAAPETLAVADLASYSSEQVLELAAFVHEVNPGALEQLAAMLAQDPMGVTALSAAALVLLYRRLRPAAAPASDIEARGPGPARVRAPADKAG